MERFHALFRRWIKVGRLTIFLTIIQYGLGSDANALKCSQLFIDSGINRPIKKNFPSPSKPEKDYPKSFEKTLREFSKATLKASEKKMDLNPRFQQSEFDQVLSNILIDRNRFVLSETVRINKLKKDNENDYYLYLVIGLNQRLRSYMKEGTKSRSVEDSFKAVFEGIDQSVKNPSTEHFVLVSQTKKLYSPSDFEYLPEEYRPTQPFFFNEILGFGRTEKFLPNNNNSLTLLRDAKNATDISIELKKISKPTYEISRIDTISNSPIVKKKLIVSMLNSILLREGRDIAVVGSVYDQEHLRYWKSHWGFEVLPETPQIQEKIGGEAFLMYSTGLKLQQIISDSVVKLFEEQSNKIENLIEYWRKYFHQPEVIQSYFAGKNLYEFKIPETDFTVRLRIFRNGVKLELRPELYDEKSNRTYTGKLGIGRHFFTTNVNLGLHGEILKFKIDFEPEAPLETYWSRVRIDALSGQLNLYPSSAFEANNDSIFDAVQFDGAASAKKLAYDFQSQSRYHPHWRFDYPGLENHVSRSMDNITLPPFLLPGIEGFDHQGERRLEYGYQKKSGHFSHGLIPIDPENYQGLNLALFFPIEMPTSLGVHHFGHKNFKLSREHLFKRDNRIQNDRIEAGVFNPVDALPFFLLTATSYSIEEVFDLLSLPEGELKWIHSTSVADDSK